MGELVHRTDYAEDAESLLKYQHQDDEALRKFAAAFVRPLQILETDLADMRVAIDLLRAAERLQEPVVDDNGLQVDTDAGARVYEYASVDITHRLDKIGGILGVEREDRTDVEFLPFILAAVIVNKSYGHAADVYAVCRTLLGNGNTLRAATVATATAQVHIAGSTLQFPWSSTVNPDRVASILADVLEQTILAGVQLEVFYQFADDANTFTCSSTDDWETNALQGCANDDGTIGGSLVGYERR